MPEQTGKACCSTSISLQHRTGGDEGMKRVEERRGQREGMGNKFVFFYFVFNWPLSAFTRVKCSFCSGHQLQ